MDLASRRERARQWVAVGVREGLSYKAVAKRAGVNERTVRHWAKTFREESAQRATPDRAEGAFVELIERAGSNASRIEIVLPGERRIVVDGTAIVEALVGVITAIQRC